MSGECVSAMKWKVAGVVALGLGAYLYSGTSSIVDTAVAEEVDAVLGEASVAGELPEAEAERTVRAPPAEPLTYNPQLSFAPLVELLGPSVVNINISQRMSHGVNPYRGFNMGRPYGGGQDGMVETGLGSGFIISSEGLILTNNHVVADADVVTVTLHDERTFQAKVVGTDPRTDIALVRIEDGETEFQPVELGSSSELSVGDWVLAIGNPFGLSQTVTTGIVSAKGRVIGAGPYDDFIQTDASINPGNSGGPLFNLHGEVVGINTAISSQGQGIGFAVPMDMVREILPQLRENGEVSRGWIGVGLASVTSNPKVNPTGLDEGVVVGDVYSGAPGALAGLQPGDIIVAIDGASVDTSDALIRVVGSHQAGESVTFDVLRRGEELSLTVTLAERPSEESLRRGTFLRPGGK